MRHDTTTTVDPADHPHGVTPWEDAGWRDAALDWARERLAEHGLRERGPAAEVRLRPWSVLVRLPVDGDGHRTVWFKANPPSSRYEAGLGQALGAWVPEHVLVPLAVEAERGWSLLPDGGGLFRDELDRGLADARAWEEPLRQYAALQRALVGRTGDLLALGVPDGRPAALPAVFDRLVEECGALDPAARAALRARRPRLVAWCEELAATGVPDSLDHSDLHESQVLVRGQDRYTFFDWGDAAVAHPFSTLLVTGRLIARRFGTDPLPRLRDVYLEAWTGDGTPVAELRRTVALASRLGAIGRALSWARVFPVRDGAAGGGDTAEATARWLHELFAEPGLWDTE
ncbi:phosphotransferase [Streptomyces tritici]|uniref:phosphotransferase n=1 Tax=Streptomyces tritici TaxID=2054410 RepID=UPI003AF1D882